MTDTSKALADYKAARTLLSEDLLAADYPLRLSRATDLYFKNRLREILSKEPGTASFSILALGGYGRQELCLKSDIDVLILYRGAIPDNAESIAPDLFHPLWDLGLDLGHGVRDIKACLDLGLEDFEVLTAHFDARHIAGNASISREFLSRLWEVAATVRTPYTDWLHENYIYRRHTFSDASSLLEPNLKEALGGLRDYHHILWLGRVLKGTANLFDLEASGLLSHNERESLESHVRYVLMVRNLLHSMSGRRNDRLYLDMQPEIASVLGVAAKDSVPGVERFLSHLHRHMGGIKIICRSFWSVHRPASEYARVDVDALAKTLPEELSVADWALVLKNPEQLVARPSLLMTLFQARADTGLPLAWETRRLVEEFLHLVDDGFRNGKHTAKTFFSILTSPHAGATLEAMLETGFLARFLPAFRTIQDMVQYDAYHLHPVGRHLVESVTRLCRYPFDDEPFLGDFLAPLSDSFALRLAALLHDIGKGDSGHSERGASLAAGILERLGVDDDIRDDVIFLIRHHLLLVETATRRDLEEEDTVLDCASIIGSERRLKMLLLLSWADAMATGPKAWNPWMENLLRELFFKILRIFQDRSITRPHEFHKLTTARDKIRSLLKNKMDHDRIEELLEAMPPRYLLHFAPREIVQHIAMRRSLGSCDDGLARFALEPRKVEDAGYWEIVLVARGDTGLFTIMAGVLSLTGINIYAADLNRWNDSTLVEVFKVSEPLDPVYAEETWERVRQNLKDVLYGNLALDYRLSIKKQRAAQTAPSNKRRVSIDNTSSDFYTLIEVIANDRPGLLYTLGRTMQDLRLDIVFATIATHLDQVADTFYVRSVEGQKIESERQQKEIKNALLHSLDARS